MALFHGNLFSTEEGSLQKFDFRTQEWRTLEIPGSGNCDLFTVAGHLFATDNNSIFEISYDGQARILASTRRRPSTSALDSFENLGFRSPLGWGRSSPPELFSGPNQTTYADIGKKIFNWTGTDWREVLNLNISLPPEIFGNAVLFRSIPSYGSDDDAKLWIWDGNASTPELVLLDRPQPHPGIFNSRREPSEDTKPAHPFWKPLAGEYLTRSAATFYRSNLYFIIDHCTVTNAAGHPEVLEKDGYHAKLVCLSRDLDEPIVVPLKFNVELGTPPLKSLNERNESWTAMDPSSLDTIMHFSHDTLFLSQRDTPGIWAIPFPEIDSAVESQKNVLAARMALEKNGQWPRWSTRAKCWRSCVRGYLPNMI